MRNEFYARRFYVAAGYLLYITSLNVFFSIFSFLNIGILLDKLNKLNLVSCYIWKEYLVFKDVPRVVTYVTSFCNIRSLFDCMHKCWGIRGRIIPLLMGHACTKSFEYKWLICFHHCTKKLELFPKDKCWVLLLSEMFSGSCFHLALILI